MIDTLNFRTHKTFDLFESINNIVVDKLHTPLVLGVWKEKELLSHAVPVSINSYLARPSIKFQCGSEICWQINERIDLQVKSRWIRCAGRVEIVGGKLFILRQLISVRLQQLVLSSCTPQDSHRILVSSCGIG